MTDLSWDDQGEEYDLKSVMHYDGDAFITNEAWLKGESTMTYKGTDERVIVWAERADSIDTVQIAKRYSNTCPIPETKMCDDGKHYYLEGRDCDGVPDCPDKSDEPIATCQDLGCGKIMYATSSSFEQSTLTFYFVEGTFLRSDHRTQMCRQCVLNTEIRIAQESFEGFSLIFFIMIAQNSSK